MSRKRRPRAPRARTSPVKHATLHVPTLIQTALCENPLDALLLNRSLRRHLENDYRTTLSFTGTVSITQEFARAAARGIDPASFTVTGLPAYALHYFPGTPATDLPPHTDAPGNPVPNP